MADESRVLHEITPLGAHEFLYIADRHKKEFTFPIHHHNILELNFVEHGAGVRRVVGDSSEVIGDLDLVLITSSELEHVWEQYQCTSEDVHEVTLQFDMSFSETSIFATNPFRSIKFMLDNALKGLAFPEDAIKKVRPRIIGISSIKDGWQASMELLQILHELSECPDARTLASSAYAKVIVESDSRRVLKVKDYINKNYMDEIRLATLADLIGMTPTSFSRFFHQHTGKSLSEYIIDIRLGYATRELVDTTTSIKEISFCCGFNNLSNFNRIFRSRKGCSPSEFREIYRKKRIKF
jgi:AraC-like DNA-binding protein